MTVEEQKSSCRHLLGFQFKVDYMPPTELENTKRGQLGGNVGKVSFEQVELERCLLVKLTVSSKFETQRTVQPCVIDLEVISIHAAVDL